MTSRSKSRSLDSRALLVATLLATVPACGGPSGPIEGARARVIDGPDPAVVLAGLEAIRG